MGRRAGAGWWVLGDGAESFEIHNEERCARLSGGAMGMGGASQLVMPQCALDYCGAWGACTRVHEHCIKAKVKFLQS